MRGSRTDRTAAAGLAVLATALGGCGYDHGIAERPFLGGNTPLGTLTPGEVEPIADAGTPTVSLARDEWVPTDFVVPVDGTVHGPLWRWDARGRGDTPRQKALYPTAETALDLRPQGGASVREAVLQPFLSIANVVALPVLAFLDPPGNRMSPSRSSLYKRSMGGHSAAGAIPVPPAPTP